MSPRGSSSSPTTYPPIEAKGLNPIVPVVVMDERESENVVPSEAVAAGADIASGAELFTATK